MNKSRRRPAVVVCECCGSHAHEWVSCPDYRPYREDDDSWQYTQLFDPGVSDVRGRL